MPAIFKRHEYNSKKYKANLSFGLKAEKAIARYIVEKKKASAILYSLEEKSTGSAPSIIIDGEKIILPDLKITSKENDEFFYIEVKRKTRWIKFEKKLEQGINYRSYLEYKKLKEKLGVPIYIFFTSEKEEPKGVFFIEIGEKENRIWDGKNCSSGENIEEPIICWSIDQLHRLSKEDSNLILNSLKEKN